MGVAGAGKTVAGTAIASATGWRFADADDYHSAANKQKMSRGEGLTDADRAPWLATLRTLIGNAIERDERLIVACSALKETYRRQLIPPNAPPGAVRFVYLDVPEDVLRERLAERHGHYAGPNLLASQLATLEKPADALWVDGTCPPEEIVRRVRTELGV